MFQRGVRVKKVETVRDSFEDIAEAINRIAPQVDYLITSGGIGPTHDDLTYEAIARAVGIG